MTLSPLCPRSLPRSSPAALVLAVALALLLTMASGRALMAARQPHWQLTTAHVATGNREFVRVSDLRVTAWTCPGNLVCQPHGQPTRTLPTADVVALQRRTGVIVPVSTPWQLILRNGDILPGHPVSTTNQDVIFDAAGLGLVRVPFGKIGGLRRSPQVAISDSIADHDTLYFSNDSHLAGAVIAIRRHHVVFQSQLGNTTIPLKRVDHIVLGGTATPPAAPAMAARIYLLNGASLLTPKFSWTSGKLSLSDPAGQTVSVAINKIARIDILGGQAVWLTDLTPTHVQQVSWIGDDRPIGINRCVNGRRLRVDGTVFSRGLGVHVNCTLTYNLAGHYQYFMVRPAMDDSARPFGRSSLSILADGKVVFTAHNLTPGTPENIVRINVKGIHTLTLRALDAGRYGVRGRVDWLTPALIRQ